MKGAWHRQQRCKSLAVIRVPPPQFLIVDSRLLHLPTLTLYHFLTSTHHSEACAQRAAMVASVLLTTPIKHAAKLRKQKHCIDTIATDTPSSNAAGLKATRCATSNNCLRRARTAHAAMQPKANKKREATTDVRVRNSDCQLIQDRVHGTVQVPHVLLFDSIRIDFIDLIYLLNE